MKRNKPINPTIIHDILDGIATIFVFLMLGALAIIFLAITGCTPKAMTIQPQLEPTHQVTVNDNGELEIIVQAKSRSISMAVTKAQFEARQKLAKHLQTNHLVGSRVALQQFATDESGIINIVTMKMVMPQPQ